MHYGAFHCSGSIAHGNFQFIGPNLNRLCSSIMENVVAKGSDKTIKSCKKGNYYACHFLIMQFIVVTICKLSKPSSSLSACL